MKHSNTFIQKNSIIHKINPSLKLVITFFLMIMIFIPYGFFYQGLLLVFCLSIFFISKLPLKKLWNILQSIIFMIVILLIINWITFKGPGLVFDIENKGYFFGSLPSFLTKNSKNVSIIENKYFVQGYLFGGKPLMDNIVNFRGNSFESNNGFYKLWEIDSKGSAVGLVGKGSNVSERVFNDLLKFINNNSNEFHLVGKLNGTTSIVNIGKKNYLFAYFYSSPWYGYSSHAIFLMLYVSIKIFLMILVATILTSTTSPIQLTSGLEDILNPLKIFKFPVTEWSTTIALGLRFIPSLLDESNKIFKAQASRGLDFKNGKLWDKLWSLISLVVPLFSIAFKKAFELANTMEARGYNPRYSRTRFRNYNATLIDWIIFSIASFMLGFLIALITLVGKPIFINIFGKFGFFEAITVYR